MKGITIGLFNDSYTPIMDGVTLTVQNYAHWLNDTLGPTYVVAPRVPFFVDREAFPVIRFLSIPTIVRPPYRIGIPELDMWLQPTLRRRNFSIVHAHSPFGAGSAAIKTARRSGIPIIATFHSKYRDDIQRVFPFKRFVDEATKRIVDFYSSVDQVWVPQESVAKTLREYGYTGHYEVVENGIDFFPPADIGPYRAQGARHLELPEGLRVGLYVGQHTLEKNLEFLLRTLPPIAAALPDFRMVFVGEGYAKAQLQGSAKDLGLSDRIIFHDKTGDRELIKAIYARADIFLFPSLYDNAPLVIREAAAFRTPSVLIRGATAAEVIRDGENGFLVDNDVEAYAARVIELLEDETARNRAGLGAQRSLCRTWEDVVREVRGRYLDILMRWAS